ncbi:MAG: S8 family serine peptidase [Inhella sp.]
MNFKHTLLALAAAATLASAGQAQTVTATPENGTLWFIELAGRPVADGADLATVQAEKARFRAAAQAAGVQFSERLSFDNLFNGLSIQITDEERRKLANVSGVRALYPVEIVPAPTATEQAESISDMVAAINLTGVNIAQNQLGLTGRGVRVGIIDSGIDIDHPAFGGSGVNRTTSFPTQRIPTGWDFVGDAYNTGGTGGALIPQPDANPDDCGGHGTHVAGIVGANGGGVRGVAPEVTFGAYRVFGCSGSSSSDIILAAMERAAADGMQIINQSLGASRQWPQFPTAQAAARLARKGVIMIASAGNNGPGGSQPDGLWAVGAPSTGDGVISVASFDNAQRSFSVGGTPYGFNAATGSPAAPVVGGASLARTGNPTSANDACNALPAGSLTGQIALIRRGTCGFYNKALNAQQAGAVGVVLYNNAPGALAPSVAGTPAVTIPVVGITAAQGATLDGLIAAGATSLTWTSNFVGHPFGTGGLISGFSSFGLAADLSFKPQLGAPGGGILSTYPLEISPTATLSGTSMSAPHVAGAAALILQAVPTAALGRTSPIVGRNTPPAINMMTRMMNTSKPRSWAGNPDLGLVEHSFRQGAGMIDVVAAIQSQQFVVPAQIATGESQAGPRAQRLTVRNDSTSPVTYTLGHRSAVAAGPNVPVTGTGASWNIGGVFDAPANVGFSSTIITVPARGMATVDVTITANATLPERSLYGGYITLTPQTPGATALSIPYGGLRGDYQSTQLLRPTANGYPWVTSFNGSTFSNCGAPAGCAAFTMASANTSPWVILQLAHHARTMRFEALDAVSGESRGVISQDEFVGRNGAPTTGSIFSYSWNGTTSLGQQPNGTYRLRMSALKPLGDAANPADWEVWTSPVITVARPQ